jgi:hypothetical protein
VGNLGAQYGNPKAQSNFLAIGDGSGDGDAASDRRFAVKLSLKRLPIGQCNVTLILHGR